MYCLQCLGNVSYTYKMESIVLYALPNAFAMVENAGSGLDQRMIAAFERVIPAKYRFEYAA